MGWGALVLCTAEVQVVRSFFMHKGFGMDAG